MDASARAQAGHDASSAIPPKADFYGGDDLGDDSDEGSDEEPLRTSRASFVTSCASRATTWFGALPLWALPPLPCRLLRSGRLWSSIVQP